MSYDHGFGGCDRLLCVCFFFSQVWNAFVTSVISLLFLLAIAPGSQGKICDATLHLDKECEDLDLIYHKRL